MSDSLSTNTPPATIESLKLHVRSYRSALKSTHEITVDSLTNSHLKMEPILHQHGSDLQKIDVSAFVYSLLRLPEEIDQTTKIVVAPTPEVFEAARLHLVSHWKSTTAPARRRKYHFNQKNKILACFINSISDIDDLVNLAISYQVEWNKLHHLLSQHNISEILSPEEQNSLQKAFGKNYLHRIKLVGNNLKNLRIQLLAGSWVDYCKATQKWWRNISNTTNGKVKLTRRPVYFVSSNTPACSI